MTKLALSNPIAIVMLCIALVVFACVVTPRMAVDTFPDITPPVLVIGTQIPGLGARDVEKTISWRIEKYVSATPGVDHVESSSRNGFSLVYVWLRWGSNLAEAQVLVQQQVAFAMAAVPKSLGVLPPFVLQYDPANAPVLQVVVSGGGLSDAQLYDYAQNNVEPVIEGIPGVASAAPNGGRLRQINIIVDPVKAQARGVTSSDIGMSVSRANALLPSGTLLSSHETANVYTDAVAHRVSDLEQAVVKEHLGHALLLRDVAKVEDGGAAATQNTTVNGTSAVYLNVLRVPGGNTIDIVDAVKAAVRNLQGLPSGVQVKALFDQSVFVRDAYHGLKQEILQALVLIALVILAFLQSGRGTLIVTVAIPLSFAITLIVMSVSGETLNSFTLGGLTLAMGRLVDDAVVVLESIHNHSKRGKSPYRAALDGANAVALPVLASTLTTMAVLLPIALLTGLARKLFVPLATTVCVAMIASYFVSMVVTPVACRYFYAHAEPGRIAKFFERAIERSADGYARALERVLGFRWWVIGASLALVGASVLWAMRLPSSFFPEVDESMITSYLRFAPGTSLDDSARQMSQLSREIRGALPHDVAMILTSVGMPGNARSVLGVPSAAPHQGFLRIALRDREERALDQRQLADRIREVVHQKHPGTELLQAPGGLVASVFYNGYLAPLALEIQGDDLATLQKQADAVAEVARDVAGVGDIYPTLETNYPEIHIDVDRQEAGVVAVDSRAAAQTTLDATLGNINTPGVWVDPHNGQAYYVVTYYDPRQVTGANEISETPVRIDPNGAAVQLGTYAKVHRDVGAVQIERNHLQRAAHLLMQVQGRDLGSVADELRERLKADPRTRDIPVHFVGQVELMNTTFSGLGSAIGLAVMVVFMIMASQFKSIRLPLVMLFTIPVTLFGIALALLSAGQGFTIPALMGVLMVIGISVSNGILLVDAAAVRVRDEGMAPLSAILQAARARFVPIAMTSIATVIGLIPTALGLEAGTASNRPLALAVVGGLTSSTCLSLFLVPTIFLLIGGDLKRREDDPSALAEPDRVH